MATQIILIRGINVGGKNKISMKELKTCFEELGFENVLTYINSGNVIVDTPLKPESVQKKIEDALPKKFKLDSEIIKILALKDSDLKKIVTGAPKGFGTQPEKYYSDVIFLLEKSVTEFMKVVETHPEVDKVWPGKNVVYFQRLGAQRTKSRLGKIISKPIYKSLTIRSWNTTTKILNLL